MNRIISLIAALTLAVGLMPMPAFAVTDAAGDDSEVTASLTAGSGLETAESGRSDYATLVQSGTVTKKEMLDLTKSLVASAIKGDPKTAAQTVLTWGSGKLLNELFGDVGNEKETTLADVLAAIDQLNSAISELQTTVDSQQLDTILNSLKPLLSYKTSYDVYNSLREINANQESGVYSEAEARQRVQSELTTSLKNGSPDKISSLATVGDMSSFDHFTELLWSAMTDSYNVTISGSSNTYTLMQVWYEHLRYKYHWEHQAYEEWAAFQSQCVTLLATTLALEKSSLQTRIELIQKWNEEHPDQIVSEGSCISRLKTVQDCINQMAGYTGKDVNDEDVDYPGLFSETTWSEAYWLCKERDESERYYWTPKHEALFFAQVNTQNIPPENDHAGLGDNCKNDGIDVWWTPGGWFQYTVWVRPKHWKSFLHYSGPGSNGSDLVSAEQLKNMYKDYGKKHLYDIFIDPKEGNFVGLDESGISTWWFVVDPDSDHEVYFKKNAWPSVKGTARCYVLSSAHAESDTATLETYTSDNAWRNKSRHFIGIGVKRYGPETYANSPVAPDAEPEYHTGIESESSQWWPTCGEMTVGYDSEALGNLTSATMDGTEIEAASFKLNGDRLVLSEAYMASLDFGRHVLELTCEHGSHTARFWIKQKQIVNVKSIVAKTYGDKGFNLGAQGADESELAYKSSNKKVAMVDCDGDVILKEAGTVKITVTASETDEYAPASATVTVKVAKAKNPVKLTKKTVGVKYAKLKKANQSATINKATNAQGKVTYSITKAVKGKNNFKNMFSINKKTSKITVKKGLAKGTYKVTVKAEAMGNTNFKPGSKNAVITVKVK